MAKINAIGNATQDLTIDPGASGDSKLQFSINATPEFVIGVDDDASDAFKVSQGSALGTTDVVIATTAGEVTKPLTPAFLADVTPATNVTGDGTYYTVVFGTERFDQNSDFDGTSTFTAPVTGKYYITTSVFIKNAGSSTTSRFSIVTSNRTYKAFLINPSVYVHPTGDDQGTYSFAVLADMDASDTSTITIMCDGGTKIVDVGVSGRTWFSANLLC